jgi:hypothetical protein
MIKLSALTLALVAAVTFVATSAQAQSPRFIKGPTGSLDATSGDFCVAFKEAGLGNTPITYTLTAQTAIFTFQCFTRSGNQPQGEPNSVSISNQFTSTTLTPRNGQITGSLCLMPEQGTAACQGNGLVLKLIAVDYQNVTLCDTTNNICAAAGSQKATLARPITF